MFLSDMNDTALFARKKKEQEQTTWRDRIVGKTNAGKAFRVGALASGAGLVGLALKNKNTLGGLKKNPKDFFTRNVHDLPKTVKTTMSHSKVKHKTKPDSKNRPVVDIDNVKTRKPGTFLDDKWQKDTDLFDTTVRETYSKDKEKGFLGSDRKIRWGNVGKAAGIAGTALAVPTAAAYVAGSKKDKEDIEKRVGGGSKKLSRGLESTRRMINTLHRVSR